MFYLMNKIKLKDENISPNEWKSQVRDAKLEDILEGHKYSKRVEKKIINSALNKHLLIPYCGRISLFCFLSFILLAYLEIKHII